MLGLLRQRVPERASDFPGFIDLQEMLAIPKIQAATHLWNDPDDRLVGFAILDRYPSSASLIFEIAPGLKDNALENQVLAWAEAVIQSAVPAPAGTFLLESNTSSDDLERIILLERLGFQRLQAGAFHLERSLVDPISQPQLPEGFMIRPIRGEQEAGDWVRLHCAALGTQVMTTEYKLAMMRTPTYDPQMDLVMVAPDGRLAAYCVCFINFEENNLTGQMNGYTDPIATHPDFQRRGLSRALLLSGLSLLKGRGMLTACLGTSSDNIAMLHSAESVGFRITKKVYYHQKPIHFT
jgi:ribosomal protein S18 acetylase RimI-like enzyme